MKPIASTTPAHASRRFKSRKCMQALESRIVFDGAAAAALDAPISTPAPPHDIVFVDTALRGWQTLVSAVKPGAQVVLLDPNKNEVDQIALALQGQRGVTSIAILSDGNQGVLQLGNSLIDSASLAQYAQQLQSVRSALAPDGDILLYGCNVGAGSAGESFIAALSAATGADVAASTGVTGKGGDWNLEVSTGAVETARPFGPAVESYDYSLSTLTVTNGNDSGAGSLRNAIASAASGDVITFSAGMTVNLSSGELSIGKNLTIDGDLNNDGTADVTVDAHYTSRVFKISSGTVTLDGLVITHGLLSGAGGNGPPSGSNPTATAGGDGLGAAIYNAGTLTIVHSGITGNVATGGGGGGAGNGVDASQGLTGVYWGGYGGGGGSGFNSIGGGNGGNGTGHSGNPDPLAVAGASGSAGSGGGGGGGGSFNSLDWASGSTGGRSFSGTTGRVGGNGGTSSGGGAGGTPTTLGQYGVWRSGGNGGTAGTAGGGGGASGYNGVGTGGKGGDAVGGIYNVGTLNIATTALSNNVGAGGGGGGGGQDGGADGAGGFGTGAIWNNGGTLSFQSSTTTFSGNIGGDGGAGGNTTSSNPGTVGATDIKGTITNSTWVPVPTVTDGNVSISGASGTGGAFKIGDTVTVSWNNTGGGDNNPGVIGVTVDFTAFGGGSAVAAIDSGGTWSATYTIVSGSIDGTNKNVSVSANNAGGTTTTADSTNSTVDNIAPTVTDGHISISGASGTGGAFKIGDTVTATWNNTAGGDNNSDVAGATADFSAFGGGSAVAMSNSGGSWSATYTIVSGSIEGTNKNVSVTATDDAGNTKTTADSINATVDNMAPTITIGGLGFSADTGASSSDFITATASQTISATLSAAPAGADVVYGSLDNGVTWTDITSKVSGTTLTWDNVTLAASSTLKFKVTDAAGNDGPVTSQAYTLDAAAPTAPAAPDMTAASDTGTSNSDNVTGNTTPTFTGTAEAGSTVTLYDTDGTTVLGTTTAVGGSWTITSSALSSGSHTVTAKATDVAGNVSAASSGLAMTIDAAAPTGLGLSATTVASSMATSTSTIAALSATDSQSVTYSLAVGNGVNDADNGRFTIAGTTLNVGASSLTAGTYKIYVAASDAAGNVANQAFTITVVDAPSVSSIVRAGGALAIVDTAATSVSYTVTFDQSVTGVDASDFTLTATGTAAGSITAVTGSGTTYTVTVTSVSGDGTLRLDLNGSGTGVQNASNVAIVGGYTSGATYTLDHTAPSAPTAPDMTAANDTGTSDSDNLTSVSTPTFSGTAETGSTVTLYDTDGTTVLGTTTAVGGSWSITSSALSSGSHTVTAKATDVAGNVSAASSGLAVTIDAAAPTGLGLSATTVASSMATSTSTVAALSATDSQSVTYSLAVGNGVNDADNGKFTIAGTTLNVGASSLTAGTYKIYVAASDAAGNVANQAFTITVVDAPSVSSIVRAGGASATVAASTTSLSYSVTFDQPVTGVDASDFTLTATGTAAGSITAVTGSGATYTVTVASLSGDGTLRLDLNGSGTGVQNASNVAVIGGYTSGATYTLDHTAPSAPTAPDMTAASDTGTSNSDNVTGNTTPTFTGTAEAGSTVTLYDTDGTTVLGTTTAVGGSWSITSSALSSGSHTVTAKATDVAGNVSAASSGLAVTIDAAAPTVASIGVPAGGTYRAGQNLDFSVSFAEAVTVDMSSGTPRIAIKLDTGGTVHANYVAGSGTDTLLFRYTVASGDNDPNGISVVALQSNGGTLRDGAGNDANLTLNNVGSTASVLVDTTVPPIIVGDVHFSADTGASSGDFVTSVAAQTVTATLSRLPSPGDIVYGSLDNGTTWIDITSKVSRANLTWDNVTLTGSDTLQLKVVEASGGDAVVTSQPYALDRAGPAVSGNVGVPVGGTYAVGQSLDFTVTFDENVAVTGTDSVLGLTIGGEARTATYLSRTPNSITYRYTVQVGDNDVDGISVGALALNTTSVCDVAGNNADVALAGHLTSTASVLVDGVAPSVASVSVPANAIYRSGDVLDFTVVFSENVTVTGTDSTLGLTIGDAPKSATYLSKAANSITYRYTVQSGDSDFDGIVVTKLTLNGSEVSDAAGSDLIAVLGNVGSTAAVLVDAMAPPAPSSPDLTATSDTGSSSSDDLTGQTTPTFTGTAEAGSVVMLYDSDGTTVLGTGVATDGIWSITSSVLGAGAHTITARATDAAGNVSVASAGLVVTIDTAAPGISFSRLALSADTGTPGDFITAEATQTISAVLSAATGAGARVLASIDDGSTWNDVTAKVSGTTLSWEGVTLTGSGTLKLKVTDAAGNDSFVASQAYVLDQSAPAAAVTGVAFSADTGASSSDFVTNTAAQTISGTLSQPLGSGEAVQVSLDNGATWATATTIAGQNLWSLAGQKLTGSNTLQVRVSDLAGNHGASVGRAYVFDTDVAFPRAALLVDTGPSATDAVTRSGTITVTDLESGATWQYSLDGGERWLTAEGISTKLTGDGAKAVLVRQIDVAGNVSGASPTLSLTLDTTAPTNAVDRMHFSADTGASSGDFITDQALQTISGTLASDLAAGETVEVSLDAGATWAVARAAVGQNTWSLDNQTLTGSNELQVRVRDLAGNHGAVASQAYVLQPALPPVLIPTLVAPPITAPTLVDSPATARYVGLILPSTVPAVIPPVVATDTWSVIASTPNTAPAVDLPLEHSAGDKLLEAGGAFSFTVLDEASSAGLPRDRMTTHEASLASGSPLPAWLHFNPATGAFSGVAPKAGDWELRIRVKTVDSGGNETMTIFTLKAAPPGGSDESPRESHAPVPPASADLLAALGIFGSPLEGDTTMRHWSEAPTHDEGESAGPAHAAQLSVQLQREARRFEHARAATLRHLAAAATQARQPV